jgi:hypothetical protein
MSIEPQRHEGTEVHRVELLKFQNKKPKFQIKAPIRKTAPAASLQSLIPHDLRRKCVVYK